MTKSRYWAITTGLLLRIIPAGISEQGECENTLHNGIEKSVFGCSNNPQYHWRHAIERMRIPEYEVRMK